MPRSRSLFPALALLALACRSDGGIRIPNVDWGPPNPQDFSTPIQEDKLLQTTVPSMDVLFVVDNSCSMDVEQTALGTNFPAMLEWFLGSGLDYHIGVVSTDMNDPLQAGRLRKVGGARWVDPNTKNPEAVFGQMVQMGTTGYWLEEGRAAAYTAIDLLASSDNAGFVRPEAGMHITVVSDENDSSTDSPISRDEFIDFLSNFRWSQRLVSFSSIVGPVTGCPDIGSPGTEYLSITDAIGGIEWPICSDDWTSVLDQLGFIATGLTREFYLSKRPVIDTIEVRVIAPDGTSFEFQPVTDWTYDRVTNSIEFVSYVPDPLAVVDIKYQVLSSVNGLEDFGSTPPTQQ